MSIALYKINLYRINKVGLKKEVGHSKTLSCNRFHLETR